MSRDPARASTVVLIRDAGEALETLLLRRNSKIAFGGMWVFPGGRVEDEDDPGGAGVDGLETARHAAVREAEEETGLLLQPGGLVPFSHWTPPPISPRRYLTWFFLAAAPSGSVSIDAGEIREHRWMPPAKALRLRDAGEIELAPPTWVTLHEISAFSRVSEALDHVQAREPGRFVTRIARHEGETVALWEGDAGYSDGQAEREGPRHRLRMGSRWAYERC